MVGEKGELHIDMTLDSVKESFGYVETTIFSMANDQENLLPAFFLRRFISWSMNGGGGVILQNKSASNSQRSSTGHAVASSYTQPHAQMNEYLVFLIIIFISFAYILNPPWHRHLILSWRLFLCVPFLQISLLNFPNQFTEQKELENLYNFHKSSSHRALRFLRRV